MTPTISKHFVLAATLIAGVCGTAVAQDKIKPSDEEKKTNIHIRVTEDKDGKVKTIEKNYQIAPMSDDERQAFIDKAVDSIGVDPKSRKSFSVTVDDGDGSMYARKHKRTDKRDKDDRDVWAFNWSDDLAETFDADRFRYHMRNFEKEFKPKARVMVREMEDFGDRFGEFWSKDVMKPATVCDLNVYSNNPDNGMLNLRFQTGQKGDVNITVTDTKGKEVAKKEIKDFSGEFVGQVELKKNTKGTLFVTVVQNEDGATRRVVLR